MGLFEGGCDDDNNAGGIERGGECHHLRTGLLGVGGSEERSLGVCGVSARGVREHPPCAGGRKGELLAETALDHEHD